MVDIRRIAHLRERNETLENCFYSFDFRGKNSTTASLPYKISSEDLVSSSADPKLAASK